MRFSFVSGNVALDFAGTRKWRDDDDPIELLQAPGDLVTWVRSVGLVGEDLDITDGDFAESIGLREAIYTAALARVDERPVPVAVRRLINTAARGTPLTPQLDTRVVWTVGDVSAVRSTIARSLLDLFDATDPDAVRRCSDPRCTRMFVDRSRGANRRWCGMSDCGNKAKAADYRQRNRRPA